MRLKHLLQGLSYPCTIEIRILEPECNNAIYIKEYNDITKIKYTWTKINYIMELFGEYRVVEFFEIGYLEYKISIVSGI